jgi:uncharacterized protein
VSLRAACLGSCGVVLDGADRLLAAVAREGREDALGARLAPDMMPAGAQIATAAGYTVRVAFPLAGRAVPELPGGETAAALAARVAAARALVGGLDPAAFEGAEARVIRHRAGFADLAQPGEAFLIRYGVPNMMFHLSMAYAALRAAGLPLGKADFDGLHAYPPGFSFP